MDLSAFKPPFIPVRLPSNGVLYTNPSLKSGFINIHEYTVTEEGIINHMNRDNIQQSLNNLLDSCISREDRVKAEELTSEDAFYLLVWLRANSFGPIYDLEVTCPHAGCGYGPETYSVDLGDLKITYMEEDVKEPLTLTLPKSHIQVNMKCLRRSTELLAAKRVPVIQQRKDYKGDPTELLKRAYCIDQCIAPNGEEITGVLDIEELCLKILPSADSLYIDTKMEYFNHGIDVRVEIPCQSCEKIIHTVIPPGTEFFRATRLSLESIREPIE